MCTPRVVAAGQCPQEQARLRSLKAKNILPTIESPKEVIFNGYRYVKDEPKVSTG